ncbi:zinc finger BED domain-containing protein RICESLEEPER 2-like [Aristolochia californica]|uniref:zinc finger BED domain-containing protein RICESLEEPER 2-like n=1 Tax=Aristolochia californica TaxID=171875 RepID=UPI0035DC6AD9
MGGIADYENKNYMDNDDHFENMDILTPPTRRRRLTSAVWDGFTKISTQNGEKASCNYCKRLFTCNSSSGTSHLKRHLEVCTQPGVDKKPTRPSVAPLSSENQGKAPTTRLEAVKFDQERANLALARMIILHAYPMDMVEHIGFINFVKSLQPKYEMITRNAVMGYCLGIIREEKQILRNLLDKTIGQISLTLNFWNPEQGPGYLSIVAQFIDNDWKLQTKVLCFKIFDMVPSFHVESAFMDSILMCLIEWNIEDRISTISMESCYTNDTFSAQLKQYFTEKNIPLLNGQLFLVKCYSHVLDLMVDEELYNIRDAINNVHRAVKYVNASGDEQQNFELVQHESSKNCLNLDAETHWTSTYLMLQAVLDMKQTICDVGIFDSNCNNALSEDDWKKVETLYLFLKAFNDASNIFRETKYPTSNLYFHEAWMIVSFLAQQSKNPDILISTMSKRMQQRFEKHWKGCSLLMTIAIVMDPRSKMQFVTDCFCEMYGNEAPIHTQLVDQSLHDLYGDYVARARLPSGEHGIVEYDDICNALPGYGELDQSTTRQQMKLELDQYLSEPVCNQDQEFDILAWWKLNTHKYPTLSRMARDILATPMSTVDSGLTLRNGGRVFEQYHGSLLTETIEALICTQNWLLSELDNHYDGTSMDEI